MIIDWSKLKFNGCFWSCAISLSLQTCEQCPILAVIQTLPHSYVCFDTWPMSHNPRSSMHFDSRKLETRSKINSDYKSIHVQNQRLNFLKTHYIFYLFHKIVRQFMFNAIPIHIRSHRYDYRPLYTFNTLT